MPNSCALAELHEIFATIGFLVCDFANFEGRLAPALALMINDNGDQASAILGQVDSFSFKWACVAGVAKTLKGKSPMAAAVLAIDADVRAVNSFRNKLAHSCSRLHPPEFWLITNATTTKRGEPKSERITEAMVQEQLDTIRAAMDRIDELIDWNKLTSDDGLMRAFRCSTGPTSPRPIPILDRRTRSLPPNQRPTSRE